MLALGSAVILVLVAGVILLAWNYRPAHAESADTEQPVPVHVVTPKRGGLERTVTRPGSVHAFEYALLFAKVPGYLHNQVVDIGVRVNKDAVLAEIDAPEIETTVTKAAADVNKAKAQVQVMEARLQSAQAELRETYVKVEQAEADVLNAVAMLKLRQQQYQRIKKLVESNTDEQELADEKMEAKMAAESKLLAQRKAVDTAKVAIDTAKAHIAAASADVTDAKAQVEVAEAVLARTQVFADYLKLRAPFDGVVTRRNYHEGDYIRAGSDNDNKPVLTVARTDLMRVIVDVPDPDVPFTHAGARAEVRIGSLSGQVFAGKVARIAQAEDYNSRTMRVEVDLPNPKDVLTDGMFGSVTINLGADPNALTIPTACLVGAEKDNQRAVFVVRDGKALQVKVHVGHDDGIHAEVLSGLRADDQVVEQHGPGLADGVAVVVR